MRYPTVFQPCRIGSLTLKNRLAMSQMTMNYATEEGMVTDKVIAYYRERAKGGVGLILVEGTYFTPEGKGYVRQIGLASQEHVEGLKRLTDAVHGLKNDTRIFLQIHHAGGRASSKVTGLQPVAPSAVPPYPGAETPRALTREEIAGLIRGACRGGRPGQGGGIRRRRYPLRPRLSRPVLLLPDDESQDRRVRRGSDRPDPFSSGDHPGDSKTVGKGVSSDDQDQRG